MTQILAAPQFDTYIAVRSHVHSNGLSMMPTAGLFPAPASVVALSGGQDFDIVVYSATRRGAPPKVPSPKTTNKNRVFLKGGRTGNFTYKDMVGITTYVVTGWLLFGILSPEGLASDFMLGALPFPGADLNELVPGSFFDYSLINGNISQVLTQVPSMPPLLQGIIDKG